MNWINSNRRKLEEKWYNEFNLKWERKLLYGYDGEEDGFHKWLNTKQQEFQSSNKQGSIPLEDGRKVFKGNGYSTLLGIKERSDLLQDKTMRVSGKRVEGLGPKLWAIEDRVSAKIWNSFRSSVEIKV